LTKDRIAIVHGRYGHPQFSSILTQSQKCASCFAYRRAVKKHVTFLGRWRSIYCFLDSRILREMSRSRNMQSRQRRRLAKLRHVDATNIVNITKRQWRAVASAGNLPINAMNKFTEFTEAINVKTLMA